MIRRTLFILIVALGCVGAAWAATAQEQTAEIDDIMQLVERGVADDIIVKHIEARGFVFTLTEDDLSELRDRGVSEAVLDAMLATATPTTDAPATTESFVMDDDDPDLYFNMSPGYFTPWYRYPVAWGFYYDPFPYYYSSYYYPVFYAGWGWYGSCHYWASPYWPGWCYPGWYNDCVAYGGRSVAVPRSPNPSRWESGRGMPGRDVALPRTRAAQPADRSRNGRTAQRVGAGESRSGRSVTQPGDRSAAGVPVVHHPSRGSSRYEARMARNRVRAANPGRSAQPAVRPSRTVPPPTSSRLESARVPRFGQVPRSSANQSLGGTLRSAPRSGSTPRYEAFRSSNLSAMRTPHFGGGMRSASWSGAGRAAAPRTGGAPRGR